jgi:hypothetical protein
LRGVEWSTIELALVVASIALVIAAEALTIRGIVRAARRAHTGWMIAMIVGLFFAWGWIAAIVYLVRTRRE